MTVRWLPVLSIAALALAGGARAAEVFKWVDDQGVVHYSDTRPADVDTVETLQLEETTATDYDPATDPYSILNQAKRIGDARQETQLEAQARERRQADDDYEEWAYADYLEPTYPAYSAYSAYPPYATPVYLPTRPPVRAARHVPNEARRQTDALATLQMTGRRPHSINSGAHRERVLESRALPLTSAPR